MNFVLDYSQFNIHNVHFLDMKKNIIIDGIFTKMVYLDEFVSLNSIYILFPCKCYVDRTVNRNNVMFSLNTLENQEITQLEIDILKNYMKHYQINKNINTTLASQIMNGRTRLYREGNPHIDEDADTYVPKDSPEIVLKISGVWETEHEVGITHKFVEMLKPY
jgi:hypothetical protein